MGWQDSYGFDNSGFDNSSYGGFDNGYGNGFDNGYGNGFDNGYGGYDNNFGSLDTGYTGYSAMTTQEDISKQYKKIERDYKKLAEMQVGQQTGIVFEKNETWDAEHYQLVSQEVKSIRTKLPGTIAPAGELIIAQYMYRVEKQFEQQTGVLERMGYTGDPSFRISLQDTAGYISAKGLKFQRIDEVTFMQQTATGIKDVRHICEAGVALGKYEEVPLVIYDVVTRRDMQGNEMYLWKETTFPMSSDRLKFYYCSRCGTVLYTYSI